MKTTIKMILAAALLTTTMMANAKITVYKPTTSYWTQFGGQVTNIATTKSWVTSTFTNGVCTYSYMVNGTIYGPFQETADICVVKLFTNNINGVVHNIVKVNGNVVYSD